MMNQIPVALGMLLCEQVIIEETTHNVTPVNCFTRRKVERVPSEPLSFWVLAFLTDGLGEMPLDIVIHRLDTFAEVYRKTQMWQFNDPISQVRCRVHIREISFPVLGKYQASLFADKEVVTQRPLVIFA